MFKFTSMLKVLAYIIPVASEMQASSALATFPKYKKNYFMSSISQQQKISLIIKLKQTLNIAQRLQNTSCRAKFENNLL